MWKIIVASSLLMAVGCGRNADESLSTLASSETSFIAGSEVTFRAHDLDGYLRASTNSDSSIYMGSNNDPNGGWSWNVNVGPGARCGSAGYIGIEGDKSGRGVPGPVFLPVGCSERNRHAGSLGLTLPILWRQGFTALVQNTRKVSIKVILRYNVLPRHRSKFYRSSIGGASSEYLSFANLSVRCPGHQSDPMLPHLASPIVVRQHGNSTGWHQDIAVAEGEFEIIRCGPGNIYEPYVYLNVSIDGAGVQFNEIKYQITRKF